MIRPRARVLLASLLLAFGCTRAASPSTAPARPTGPRASAPTTTPLTTPTTTPPPAPVRTPPAKPAPPPPTFRPALADLHVLREGHVLVLARPAYRSVAGFDDHVPDHWVLADGAAPCLAHPATVTKDDTGLACSAVDCAWRTATISLEGCPAGALAVAAPPAVDGVRPVPTWRYVDATVTAGSDLEPLDPSSEAYRKASARYARRRGRTYGDPHLVRRAAVATEVPARYRALVPALRCGKRCALSWSVARLELEPPLEAVVISKTERVGDARCHMRSATVARLFTITPSGPVAVADDEQPAPPGDPDDRFTGAVIEDGRVVYLTSTSDEACVPAAR